MLKKKKKIHCSGHYFLLQWDAMNIHIWHGIIWIQSIANSKPKKESFKYTCTHTHIYIFWFVKNDFIGLILFLLVFEQNAHAHIWIKKIIYRCVLVVEHKGSSTPCEFNLSYNGDFNSLWNCLCHQYWVSISVAQWVYLWSNNPQVISLNIARTFVFMNINTFLKVDISTNIEHYFHYFQVKCMIEFHICKKYLKIGLIWQTFP